jgi:hypothetical protein
LQRQQSETLRCALAVCAVPLQAVQAMQVHVEMARPWICRPRRSAWRWNFRSLFNSSNATPYAWTKSPVAEPPPSPVSAALPAAGLRPRARFSYRFSLNPSKELRGKSIGEMRTHSRLRRPLAAQEVKEEGVSATGDVVRHRACRWRVVN